MQQTLDYLDSSFCASPLVVPREAVSSLFWYSAQRNHCCITSTTVWCDPLTTLELFTAVFSLLNSICMIFMYFSLYVCILNTKRKPTLTVFKILQPLNQFFVPIFSECSCEHVGKNPAHVPNFIYFTHLSAQQSPGESPLLHSFRQNWSVNRCVVVVWRRRAEGSQLPHISPTPPCYSGSQWGVRALETTVEWLSGKIINSSLMLTGSSETCSSLERFHLTSLRCQTGFPSSWEAALYHMPNICSLSFSDEKDPLFGVWVTSLMTLCWK